MVDAALGGFGRAYVPKELVAPHVSEGRLNWVLEDWYPAFTGFHVYYSSRRHFRPWSGASLCRQSFPWWNPKNLVSRHTRFVVAILCAFFCGGL
jgi:hypothetical protein